MNRQFVLRNEATARSLWAFLKNNWRECSAAGRPLAVTVAEYRKTRTNEQNALLWVWMTKAADQAFVAGRQFSPEVWHEHTKRLFLPERNARGDDKWEVMPDGEMILRMSTTRLNTAEMGDYMTAVAAYLTTEIGVDLDA